MVLRARSKLAHFRCDETLACSRTNRNHDPTISCPCTACPQRMATAISTFSRQQAAFKYWKFINAGRVTRESEIDVAQRIEVRSRRDPLICARTATPGNVVQSPT